MVESALAAGDGRAGAANAGRWTSGYGTCATSRTTGIATVDDVPYGGGPGMVMKPEPLFRAVDAIGAERGGAVGGGADDAAGARR